ncbi:MAG: helix-turn-helix domain-containing protein [Acidimicrobiia bacterium]
MGRALPGTVESLHAAINDGLLVEDHHTDFKRELAAGKAGNKSLAADIASMAVDGGLLMIGVTEDKATGLASLSAVPLVGLKERIDQVARDIPRPSVNVRVHEIRETDTAGYALVEVPMSLDAPHMVDGSYRGRGDSTNRILTDAEVTRLHSIRESFNERINTALDYEINRDPWNGATRLNAHVHVVALPIQGSPSMLDDTVRGDCSRWMSEVCNVRDAIQSTGVSDYAPTFGSGFYPRANGYALCDEYLGGGRVPSAGAIERYSVDLEIWEDGSIHSFNARGSDENNAQRVVMTAVVRGFVAHTLAVARHVATVADYNGGWSFGLAVTGLQHMRPYSAGIDFGDVGSPYSEPEYRRATRCDHTELVDDLGVIADRLYLRLHHALGLRPRPML